MYGPRIRLLACALLCAGLSACGSSGGSKGTSASTGPPAAAASTATTTAASTVPAMTATDSDRDNDEGGETDDNNHRSTEAFGHAASASDARAIAALVKRYYAIALSGNGAHACALLFSTLEEAVPEDYGGRNGGPPPSNNNTATCPSVLDALFAREHARLAFQLPKLSVRRVRVNERHGLVFLSFGPKLPEREIEVMREGTTWRMEALMDGELP